MKLTPLQDGFAARVEGIAVRDVVTSAEACGRVREAFEAHSVLVWSRQELTDETQAAFSRAFGPLELTKEGGLGANSFFAHVTNILPDGSIAKPSDREAVSTRANQLWHTDSSFKATPALSSALSAHTVPPSGGETEFASTRLAFEELDAATRAEVEALVGVHDYANSRRKVDPGLQSFPETRRMQPVRWRLTWRNPAHGRTSLYLASHIGAIEGLSPERSQALLEHLVSFATRPGRVYTHRWSPGDVVLWDNRATLHRGRGWPEGAPRRMLRTTTSAVESDGLASVRPPPAAGGAA